MTKPPNPLSPPETPFTPTAGGLIRWAAARFGPRDAVVTPTGKVSYDELERRSRRLAKRLIAAGVAKGTRVGIQFPNGVDFAASWFAVTRIGAVVVPLSTFYPPAEIRKVLRLADIHLLITSDVMLGRDQCGYLFEAVPALHGVAARPILVPDTPMLREVWMLQGAETTSTALPPWACAIHLAGDHQEAADEAVDEAVLDAIEAEITPADWITMIHTSGTTSDPKGVIHTHGTIMRQGWAHTKWWAFTFDQRVFSTMALFWIGGLGQWLLPAICTGGAILLQEKPDPGEAIALLESGRATRIAGYGSRAISDHPSFVTADLTETLRQSLNEGPKPPHGTSFGMTETAAIHSTVGWDEELPPQQRGSHGRPIPGVQLRIVDPDTGEVLPDGSVGSLHLRGHVLMVGMNKKEREAVFDADGWYDTGDRCFLRDGLLWFRGRYNEMIKTSGANVAPLEVEEALRTLPEVADAAVLGVDDDEREQSVAAALTLAPGAQVDLSELARRLRSQLSAYKVPRRWLIVEPGTLPTLANGKPDRRAIAAMLAERSREPNDAAPEVES